MKKTHLLVLLCLTAIVLAVSCAATPPAAPQALTEEASPPPPSPPPPAPPPPAPAPLSPADAFKAQTGMTPDEYYAQKVKEIYAARDAAISAGAEWLAPEYLLDADGIALDALGKWEAEDYFSAMDTAEDALAMYIALKDGLDAYKIREEIAVRAERLAPEYLFDADSVGLDALGKWDDGNYQSAKNAAADALAMYSALKAGLRAYEVREEIVGSSGTLTLFSQADRISLDALDKWDAKDYPGAKSAAETAQAMYLNIAASAERQKALDYKANVAVRQEYASADDIYSRASAGYRAQRYEAAAALFDESWAMFKVVAAEALKKRQAAEEALRMSDQRLTESDETAKQAELILEGGR